MAGELCAVGFFPFHLDVVTPSATVGFLRAKQLVERDVFELFRKAGLTRQAQELRVELQSGDGDAGFADVAVVRQIEIVVKMLAVTGRAGDIKPVVHDVLPGVETGVQ